MGQHESTAGSAFASSQKTTTLSDRDLHDQVIRYLADATVQGIDTPVEFLEDSQTRRAKQFSRFLARRYYRDRLTRSFRQSARLLAPKEAADQVADSETFDSILEKCVLGSLLTSRAVGGLAVAKLLPLRREPWWSDLVEYERAFFVQAATSERQPATELPRMNPAAVVRTFAFRVPELLPFLRAGKEPPKDLLGSVTLLFSRTHQGRIYVVEIDEIAQAVLQRCDGSRDAEQIARSCGLSQDETQRILTTLAEVGATVVHRK